ncbi:uncharacterized protein EV154DRAFT_549996 [Mucor mucedo]|uniref:G-patch domain-containing protein n=1 Tax=Mucor saturninus TaxID=64648 RepID=A0A8H7QJS1_9FUNG|nr:uncharacterized protein EV154DRAFT_549996 [Mucor mucedo]KAG2193766.1 hypothetical protein INT47_006048 [Mucor saturninus]KAI7893435.1 hypothetical protein EV154DRAFT_549996 [Mucor mucedo]
MDKWKGSFAQTQLEKFGWENGEGLGKNKEGNVKHINVSIKNDKKGVGVNGGNWEFAWWDHLYNKSASAVVVAKEEGEIKLATNAKPETRRSTTGIISTQRPSGKVVKQEIVKETTVSMGSMADARNMMDSVKDIHVDMAQRVATASLYGSFVKSATTDSTIEEEDDELKDYSVKITDAELFAACEGRTARKGGRGLVDQTGKFKRVMQDYVRPVDEDDVDTKKRKHTGSDEKSSKKQKKEDKKIKKAEKAARRLEKAAKKAAKAEKKAAKAEKKAKKEAKKLAKAANKKD